MSTPTVTPDQTQQAPPQTAAREMSGAPVAPATGPASTEGLFDKILDTIGGGSKKTYTVDESGKTQTVETPQTRGQLAKHIIAGALTGLAAGAAQRGPGAMGKAGAAGFEAGFGQVKDQDQKRRAQAQQDFQNQQVQQLKQAQIYEANSRTVLNTAQAEKLGTEQIESYIQLASPQLEQMKGAGLVDDEHISQTDLMAGLKSGKYKGTANTFIPDGMTPKLNPDGSPMEKDGKPVYETTFAHVQNGQTELSQDLYDKAAAHGIPGFTAGVKLAPGQQISTVSAANITAQISAMDNARGEVGLLQKSLGDKAGIPNFDDSLKTPGMSQALMKLQPYMNAAGGDPYLAIQKMSAGKQDPKTGREIANPDARYASILKSAFGGDQNLVAYHNKLEAEAAGEKSAGEEAGKLPGELKLKRAEASITEGMRIQNDNRKEAEKDARTYGSAIDPRTNERIYTTLADANRKGLQGFEEMKGGDIKTEKSTVRQLNDVQSNTSRYTQAAKDYASVDRATRVSDQAKIHDILNKAGVFDAELKIGEGGEVKIPVVSAMLEGLSREMKSDSYGSLSPQGKALVDGYYRQMASVPAYQKALTQMGRTNKEALDLELANIANPAMADADILRKQQAFQENIDRATDGLVKFPDISSPKEVRRQYEKQPVDFSLPHPLSNTPQPTQGWGAQFGGTPIQK